MHGPLSEARNFTRAAEAWRRVLGCHNAIWELAGSLIAGGINQTGHHEELAADLTNTLVPGVIATPATKHDRVLQHGGFVYS